MSNKLKIKIIGAGPTGSLLALSLSKIGCDISLFDTNNCEQIVNKNRAYAINNSSRKILASMGLWQTIEKESNKFNNLVVKDNLIDRQALFTIRDLTLSNKRSYSIGWILDHRRLMTILMDEVFNSDNINLKLNCNSNYEVEGYDYIIAADGSNSFAKSLYSIKSHKLNYNQACLTVKLLLRGADDSKAYEILMEEGPFAILPMGGELYQIVWSSTIQKCKHRMSISPANFLDEIATLLPNGIEPDAIIDSRQCFPVSLSIASIFFKQNCILIGDSAHNLHPVGGQGLNLCWRDIRTLTSLIKLLDKRTYLKNYIPNLYFISRIVDVYIIGFLTDFLVRFYSNRHLLLITPRYIAIKALQYSNLARKLVLYLMTNGISLL
tara:strand:+ start:535 stop:1674 length:1140 start_codon:yes stop_codon:yes gene_type:complete